MTRGCYIEYSRIRIYALHGKDLILSSQCLLLKCSGNPIGWSKDGVRTEKGNSSVVCKSNHLTSFAVLVNVGGVKHVRI